MSEWDISGHICGKLKSQMLTLNSMVDGREVGGGVE